MQPFFTRDLVVARPPVTGLWTLKGTLYEFGHRIARRTGKGISGPIESTFFTIDGQLFLDTTAGKIEEEELDIFWRAQVVPVHLLFKVEVIKDRLLLQPLDDKHVGHFVEEGKADLPHVIVEKNRLFTASSEQWVEFLRRSWRDKKLWSGALELTAFFDEGTLTIRNGRAYLPSAQEPFSGQAGVIEGSRVSKWSRYSRGLLKQVAVPDIGGGRGREERYVDGRLVAVDRWVGGKLEAEFLGPQPVDIPLPAIAQPLVPPELVSGGATVERGVDGIFRLAGAKEPFTGAGVTRHMADGHIMTFGRYRDGRYDGVLWDYDGYKKPMTTYRMGIKEGPTYGWHENGRIAFAGNHHNDEPDGEFVEWFFNGCVAVRRHFRNGALDGPFETWHNDGTPRESGTYSMNAKTGVWRGWGDDGESPKEELYENGKRIEIGQDKVGPPDVASTKAAPEGSPAPEQADAPEPPTRITLTPPPVRHGTLHDLGVAGENNCILANNGKETIWTPWPPDHVRRDENGMPPKQDPKSRTAGRFFKVDYFVLERGQTCDLFNPNGQRGPGPSAPDASRATDLTDPTARIRRCSEEAGEIWAEFVRSYREKDNKFPKVYVDCGDDTNVVSVYRKKTREEQDEILLLLATEKKQHDWKPYAITFYAEEDKPADRARGMGTVLRTERIE
ncbi:MAG TPA: hypothetical protein VN317_01520 [Candidatus Methanoperedens sp.]|nr:hypothetical protein [Candidatus Methanoperedens sp.]